MIPQCCDLWSSEVQPPPAVGVGGCLHVRRRLCSPGVPGWCWKRTQHCPLWSSLSALKRGKVLKRGLFSWLHDLSRNTGPYKTPGRGDGRAGGERCGHPCRGQARPCGSRKKLFCRSPPEPCIFSHQGGSFLAFAIEMCQYVG